MLTINQINFTKSILTHEIWEIVHYSFIEFLSLKLAKVNQLMVKLLTVKYELLMLNKW